MEGDNALLVKITSLEKQMDELKELLLVGPLKLQWINESWAAKMVGYAARTFREKCKAAELPINYRVNPGGQGYQYHLKDIQTYLDSTSTLV